MIYWGDRKMHNLEGFILGNIYRDAVKHAVRSGRQSKRTGHAESIRPCFFAGAIHHRISNRKKHQRPRSNFLSEASQSAVMPSRPTRSAFPRVPAETGRRPHSRPASADPHLLDPTPRKMLVEGINKAKTSVSPRYELAGSYGFRLQAASS